MDADQNEICQYLKSWPGQFVSRKEICRRAGGKWRYREDENWALPVLQRMLECRLVESNSTGHYRLLIKAVNEEKNKKRLWVSPTIRAILQKSGRNFGVIDLDKELELTGWSRDAATEITYQLNR
jgi:hypothetical protein